MTALAPETAITDPGDRRYVDLDEEGARGDAVPLIDRLVRNIDLLAPDASGCQLLTGLPGTGKTTERYRLRQRLEARDSDAAPGYATRLWRWLQSDIELKNLGFGAFGANLAAEIRDNPSVREKVERAVQLQFQPFAREARTVCEDAVNRIRKQSGRRRVVVLVDGLEKFVSLSAGADKAREMEAAVEALFCTHAEWLRLPAQMVYTFPMWLRFRRPDLGALYGASPLTLPMVKIRRVDGTEHEPGICRLAALITTRLPDGGALGADPVARLRPAILASGGYPRDLLRIVREAVLQSQEFPVSEQVLAHVIEQVRQDYDRALLLANLDVLVDIARNRRLPAGEDALRACQRLFELALVLTYHNAEEWADVHPLGRSPASRMRGCRVSRLARRVLAASGVSARGLGTTSARQATFAASTPPL